MSQKAYVELTICQTINCTTPGSRIKRDYSSGGAMDEQERQKKLEAGKAKLESEISTPADDYSSEEEELEFGEKYTDHEVQNTKTELQMMKNELAGKQQEIEELNKELEEMRAAYGTDGLQQEKWKDEEDCSTKKKMQEQQTTIEQLEAKYFVQSEKKLKEQLDMLKTEQSDLKLQMEAQRICLSVVYSAHVNQVREYMENEKESALSALKEELQLHHAQELCELKKNQIVDNKKTVLQETLQSLLNNIMETSQRLLEYQVEFIASRKKLSNEDDAAELLEKQYQEKLLQEVAKNESVSQTEKEEHILEGEDGEERQEQTSLDILSKERCTLQKASSRLMKILLDIVKTTAAVEETIGHLVVKLLDQSPKSQFSARVEDAIKSSIYVGYEPERQSSQYIGNDLESQDNIMWSEVTDEEFELTQFLGMEIDTKNEQLILNINTRLQAVFEKLLQTINETANQLEHAKATQTELMQESFKWEHEATELTKCQEELQERFDEEVRAREQIALELSKAEKLLAETEKLMKEKIEVQRQAEKEYNYLQKQVKALETDIEEQVNQFLELEQEKNAELMDLRQQNQALEKQLEKTKKFLDEQAIDREHERDVFQQEIQKLEQQLKIPQRLQPVSEHQNREMVAELGENKQGNYLELEKIRLESAAAKEELNNYKEKAEKLKEHLLMTYQRSALDFLQNAERQSLLMEISILHAQLNRHDDKKEEIEIHPKCQELLGYNMEMQIELKNTKDRTAELQEQLSSERMMVAELKNELGQTKLELETTLKAQHKHLRDLEAIRNELKGKATELDILKSTITNKQKKSREFQWALEKERAKVEHGGKREKEEIEISSDTPSSASLTERLLKQNVELTGFVSRLSEEKNNMRNTVMKLEEELRRYQYTGSCGDSRVYGRYLRAESFRKALIYQKKYLLLLLGGFQECEEATLTLIARMGGQPSYTQLEVITHHSKSFTRFRSVVRVLIAISRYQGIHTDFSPVSLACSQLQNYDPDRALTDYINRLDSLQRRLGNVQPASASQTQLHSALRR
ncbi:A-kinase anchor protein 9 [Crotalus adamanteus]|uniref:A-kinase anchor protein 9 n=1 Tax=Crotalus adamanteus TaxID=8729 RepID=A0AAW1B2Q1_CROAD